MNKPTWKNVHVDDYGWVGKLRLVQDRIPVDVSTYTTLRYVFAAPSGATKLATATFDTTGVDGILKCTIGQGVIDEVGAWQVQARISKAGAEITSDSVYFDVEERVIAP